MSYRSTNAESAVDTCEPKPNETDPYTYHPEPDDCKTFDEFFKLINKDPTISCLPMILATTGTHMNLTVSGIEIVIACRGNAVTIINWSRFTEHIGVDNDMAFSDYVFLKYNGVEYAAKKIHELIQMIFYQARLLEEYQYREV